MTSIRAKALCLFRHNDKVLLAKAYDPNKNEYFFRPIGGGIEFGETSIQAIEREVLEEIQQQLTQPKLVCVMENLFSFDGQQGHEIVFVYDAEFVDPYMYKQHEYRGAKPMDIAISHSGYVENKSHSLNILFIQKALSNGYSMRRSFQA